jgi:uncharacterized tellurite resistance protein B-like protein
MDAAVGPDLIFRATGLSLPTLMFGNWLNRASVVQSPQGAQEVESTVRAELKGADEETVYIVTAIAGLLGAVAYADSVFSEEEQARVRAELGRIQGMTSTGVEAVCAAIGRHLSEIATIQVPRYTRVLRELADRELRLQLLEILVALAAADEVITTDETDVLRKMTASLGLTQDDYNDAQAKFRDQLSVLKRR